jgi:saccharopine dehydrogenase (NAD+, L-lysine-forming)
MWQVLTHLNLGDLLPSLLGLNDRQNVPVWARAEKLFNDKVATLPASALEN